MLFRSVGTEINPFRPMSDLPTVRQLEEGIEYYVSIAKNNNLKVILGTLLPIYGWRTYAPFREKMKNEFNDWVRAYKGADGFIDFERALRSETNISAFADGFNSGDNLHPSEEAYKVMAELAFGGIQK